MHRKINARQKRNGISNQIK